MTKARGLGRGIDALFQSTASQEKLQEGDSVEKIAVSEISANRHQPRKDFAVEALNELAESIKRYGVLQPILVRRMSYGFELIAGERRLRAAKIAGLKQVPAIIREFDEQQTTEIALIENVQRENLTAIEEAIAYDRMLREFSLTQEDIAKKVGKSRSHIANFLRLLKLPPEVRELLSNGSLSMGQAKPLLTLNEAAEQIALAQRIAKDSLSARQAEEMVKLMQAQSEQSKQPDNEQTAGAEKKEVYIADAEEKLKLILGTQVKIKTGKNKGKLEIEFYSAEDLERLIELLVKEENIPAFKRPNQLKV